MTPPPVLPEDTLDFETAFRKTEKNEDDEDDDDDDDDEDDDDDDDDEDDDDEDFAGDGFIGGLGMLGESLKGTEELDDAGVGAGGLGISEAVFG